MKQIRLGAIGWLHYYDNEHARTVAACDVNEEKLKKFASQHPETETYTDYRKMAEEGGLDAVMISTPNWLHREMAECFLEHGIHVFLEKPMGVHREEMDSLLKTARQSGKILAVDFELRVSPATLRLKEIIASGEIGDLHGVEFIHHRGGWVAAGNNVWRTDPERSGGLFLMEICHEVDLFRYIFGEITHVQSFSHGNLLPQYPENMPDNVYSFFRFAGGQMGVVMSAHTSSVFNATPEKYDDMGHDMQFIITGTAGCVRMDCIHNKLLICKYEEYHPDAPVGRRVAFKRLEDHSSVPGFSHDIAANQRAFLESCAMGRPFHQDIEDVWRTHVVCLAAERSAVERCGQLEIDYTLPK